MGPVPSPSHMGRRGDGPPPPRRGGEIWGKIYEKELSLPAQAKAAGYSPRRLVPRERSTAPLARALYAILLLKEDSFIGKKGWAVNSIAKFAFKSSNLFLPKSSDKQQK